MNPASVTIADLAAVLKLTPDAAWSIASNPKRFYKPTWLKRRNGKKPRDIREPRPVFKVQLQRLNAWIQKNEFAHIRAYGGVKGRSHLMHAARHCGHQYVWTLDVTDCFPSVRPAVVKRQLLRRGFRSDVARFLTQIMTVDDQIPQGAPTSNPALDFTLYELDDKLLQFGQSNKLFTGRYADDIVVSGEHLAAGREAVGLIKATLAELGLDVNPAKEEKAGFKTRAELQIVHGTVTNDPHGPRITPTMRADYVAFGENYVAACRAVRPDNIEIVRTKRNRFVGMIYYAKRLRASKVGHLEVLLQRGDQAFDQRVAKFALTLA